VILAVASANRSLKKGGTPPPVLLHGYPERHGPES